MAGEASGLSFWEHVGALRAHLIAAAICFGAALALVLIALAPLLRLFAAPLAPHPVVFLSPLGPFAFQMRVAMMGAFTVSLGPWAVLLVHFVAPALSRPARRWTWVLVLAAAGLSLVALAATYFWVMPWSLKVLSAASVPGSEMLLTADSYLDLFALETLFTALLLQLPLLLALLSLWGLIDPHWLARRRDILYLILIIVVAVVTPTTDIVSLLLAMVPATLSLEAGVLAAHLIHSRRRRGRHAGATMDK